MLLLNGHRVSVLLDKKVLEIFCITVCIYHTVCEKVKVVHSMLCVFLSQLKMFNCDEGREHNHSGYEHKFRIPTNLGLILDLMSY